MANKIFMTALSPTMEVGTIVEWKVKEGDSVKEGDILAEVETDKASMDLLSDESGTILKIFKPKGGEAKVGDIIAAVGKEGEDISAIVKELEDSVAAPLVTPPNESNAVFDSGSSPVNTQENQVKKVLPQKKVEIISGEKEDEDQRIKASPLARRLASQRGIDLNYVRGTGPQGRILKEDLEGVRMPLASVKRTKASSSSDLACSPLNDELIPLTGKRKVIAERLSESKNSAPHFYLMTSIEMDGLLSAREQLNKGRKEGKVGLNAFLIKIIAQVIMRHQVINSSWMGDSIQNHSQVDIGLAVAQADGLITPIVKNCGQKGILEIDRELGDLVSRARTNKLKSEEYTGATFTISSLGSMGIEQFTSIINPPGVAILAIGSVKKEVVVNEKDELAIKKIMKVTLSCDHRVVDGAVGALFLKDLRDSLENPIMALY